MITYKITKTFLLKPRVSLVVLLLLVALALPGQAYADWPPFRFSLTPSYAAGKITYDIKFASEVNGTISNVRFNIPLPSGTRFVEASAPPTTRVDFNGAEITFMTATVHRPIKDARFTVEVTDPAKTIFATHAWIAWEGDQPGNFLTEDESIDINQQPLMWTEPSSPAIQLEATAAAANNLVTYTVYPSSVTGRRIWDFKVKIPIPDRTKFVSAEAPPTFVTNFDGREVTFSTLELKAHSEPGPLSLKVSTDRVAASFLNTFAWATWKNVGAQVAGGAPAQEDMRTSDLVIQPGTPEQVVVDKSGDTPFPNYDLTSIAIRPNGAKLEIIFYTAGEPGPLGQSLEYSFYIDSDCRADTGKTENGRGVDYRVRYNHDKGKTSLDRWIDGQESWDAIETDEVESITSGSMIVMRVPGNLLNNEQHFCWTAEARNKTKDFYPAPPAEIVPDGAEAGLTEYNGVTTANISDSSVR